ncbi:hypothetical protein [Rhizobium lusitanum]|jgi:hypothetical protein|uniref:hypothetical protein n=1 Tax=Rhizobium lusitanum TaxID=293958 RepID=UPI0012E0BF36|nr:hypothetical protein [Rhizobium lusitanum]NTJ06644.1 hypothetical protein [Rhizobium lusitanum]
MPYERKGRIRPALLEETSHCIVEKNDYTIFWCSHDPMERLLTLTDPAAMQNIVDKIADIEEYYRDWRWQRYKSLKKRVMVSGIKLLMQCFLRYRSAKNQKIFCGKLMNLHILRVRNRFSFSVFFYKTLLIEYE